MDEQKTAIQKPNAAVADYSNEINAMYDAQRQQQTQNLENAYNQNLSTLQQSKEQIAPTYFNQGNDLATQYERTRRNNNMRADMNGLNTGTASQMDLAQQSNYLSSYGQVRAAQANAERQADRQIADLEMGYKNSVAQALADNDYQRAAAMLSEYKRRDEAAKEEQRYQYQIQTAEQKYQDQLARQQEQDAFAREQYNNSLTRQQEQDAFARQQYNNSLTRQQAQDEFARQQYADQLARQQQQDAFSREQYNYQVEQARNQQALNDAKQKAAYGDFSGYATLYGQETADAMKQFWAMNNPDYAYAMGLISASEYEAMTGMAPGGYSSGGSSGGSYYRRSGGGGGGGGSPEVSGPGTYDPNNGGLTEPSINPADRFDASYYEYLDVMGSEKRAYEQMMKDREKEVKAALGQGAVAAGLTPGSSAYNNYVNDRANDALLADQWYKAAKDGYNDYAAQADARAQARANEAKKTQIINAAAQGLNPQNSVTNAEVAFWQRVFGGGNNSSNTSSGSKSGSTTNKTTTNKTTAAKPSATKKTTSSAQTISGKQRAKL